MRPQVCGDLHTRRRWCDTAGHMSSAPCMPSMHGSSSCCPAAGAPGLGPLSVRKEIMVFEPGFRSRAYCLSECTQVCAASLGVK